MSRLSKRWKVALIVIPVVAVLAVVGGGVFASQYLADNPAACGKCHLMQPYVQSYFSSNFLDSVHGSGKPAARCEDCHRQTIFQQTGELISFIKGDNMVSGKDVNTQESCLSCHNVATIVNSVKNRPEFVANPKLSYHLNAENAKACRDPRAELVECQDCHKAHEAPVNYCSTCHVSSFSVPDK